MLHDYCSQLICLVNCVASGLDTWILYCNHEWLIKLCSKYLRVLTNVTVRVKTSILFFLTLFIQKAG